MARVMENRSKIDFMGMDCFIQASNARMETLIAANLACLEQGIMLLDRLPSSIYVRECPGVFNSTIGEHIRHNLDHYAAFIDGEREGEIDYDARKRQNMVETDPLAARQSMGELVARFQGLVGSDLDRRIRIRMDDGGASNWSETTLRRELQFLLSHSIHHYALVVSIATQFGHGDFPEGFGVAPSTLHYLEQKRG
jgi:uncharacterized damage-inducible protein DinB